METVRRSAGVAATPRVIWVDSSASSGSAPKNSDTGLGRRKDAFCHGHAGVVDSCGHVGGGDLARRRRPEARARRGPKRHCVTDRVVARHLPGEIAAESGKVLEPPGDTDQHPVGNVGLQIQVDRLAASIEGRRVFRRVAGETVGADGQRVVEGVSGYRTVQAVAVRGFDIPRRSIRRPDRRPLRPRATSKLNGSTDANGPAS